MIAIIDYDAGNIRSVEKAITCLGKEAVITREREQILMADKVILPGVGAFGHAADNLERFGLHKVIQCIAQKGTPFLGICLGLQLLFERSEEAPGVPGLGILKGEVLKIPNQKGLKIPHTGWNSLCLKNNGRLFRGIEDHPYVYFVHSYYLKAQEEAIVTASADYGVEIHASVEYKNIFACQFHPEKSGGTGLRILKNFVELGQEGKLC